MRHLLNSVLKTKKTLIFLDVFFKQNKIGHHDAQPIPLIAHRVINYAINGIGFLFFCATLHSGINGAQSRHCVTLYKYASYNLNKFQVVT